jgi:signal transduction histidine kinase
MSISRNVTISLPDRLFEAGLTEREMQELVKRWLVIWLFEQGKITATDTEQLLAADRERISALQAQQKRLYRGDGDPSRQQDLLEETTDLRWEVSALQEELTAARQALAEMEKQLKEADKLKNEFIATISHELRTPLNSIIGFAKLLLNQKLGPLNEVQHTDLSVIYSSAQHLLSLVNDILDLSKIEAGKMRLDREWFSVEEIIVGVIASMYILIEGKPIELREEIEPNLPQVYVDLCRIRQVVLNILSNAAKFTDAGSITMQVHRLNGDGREFVAFRIKDTGIGIAPEDMDKVFEAFRQIDSSIARRAEGTGLGMPISRYLVELHGGELWVESQVGQGSTFYFTIPVEPPEIADTAETVGTEA